jgi:arsenate reductase
MPGTRRRSAPTGRLPRVLFLSTGNAARSAIAEAALLWLARGTVAVTSAGVRPLAEVDPLARDAVRRVFNGRISHARPRGVAAVDDDARFDVVFTLSQEAREAGPLLARGARHVHWDLGDPSTAEGTRTQRQAQFDRLTRDILKRVRAWWREEGAAARHSAARPRTVHTRPHLEARWRTRPGLTTPILAVAYAGPMRSCVNMCALLERSGFQVLCSDKFAETPAALPILPDGIVVRVDGIRRDDAQPRAEFRALTGLRQVLSNKPIAMLVDRMPSPSEMKMLETTGVRMLRRKGQHSEDLMRALRALVQRPALPPEAPTIAVTYFGPPQRCVAMCAQLQEAGFQVLCGEQYGREPRRLPLLPDGMVVRVDHDQPQQGDVRPEFQAVAALRDALGVVPILMLGDVEPSTSERVLLENCHAAFLDHRQLSEGDLANAVNSLVQSSTT